MGGVATPPLARRRRGGRWSRDGGGDGATACRCWPCSSTVAARTRGRLRGQLPHAVPRPRSGRPWLRRARASWSSSTAIRTRPSSTLVHAGGALGVLAGRVGRGGRRGCGRRLRPRRGAGHGSRRTRPWEDGAAAAARRGSRRGRRAGRRGRRHRHPARHGGGARCRRRHAVRVGTRFVAATEADAHPDYVAALIAAQAEDTVLTRHFSVMWPDAPHRVLRSAVAAAEAWPDDVVGEMELFGTRQPLPRSAVPAAARHDRRDRRDGALRRRIGRRGEGRHLSGGHRARARRRRRAAGATVATRLTPSDRAPTPAASRAPSAA